MKQILGSILTVILIIAHDPRRDVRSGGRHVKSHRAFVSPLARAAAIGAELVLGIVLLLGTVWLATHLAVRIFHVQDPSSSEGPRA